MSGRKAPKQTCSCVAPQLETRKHEQQFGKRQWWLPPKASHKKVTPVYYCTICGFESADQNIKTDLAMMFFRPAGESELVHPDDQKETEDEQS